MRGRNRFFAPGMMGIAWVAALSALLLFDVKTTWANYDPVASYNVDVAKYTPDGTPVCYYSHIYSYVSGYDAGEFVAVTTDSLASTYLVYLELPDGFRNYPDEYYYHVVPISSAPHYGTTIDLADIDPELVPTDIAVGGNEGEKVCLTGYSEQSGESVSRVICLGFYVASAKRATIGGSERLTIDSAGNVYVIAEDANLDFLVMKFGLDGTMLWEATKDYSGLEDVPVALAVDSADNVVVTGESGDGLALIKLDPNGDEIWSTRTDPSSGRYQLANWSWTRKTTVLLSAI